MRPVIQHSKKLFELAHFLHVDAPEHDVEFTGLSLNTSALEQGDLFIALDGDKAHGASYLETAIGAIAVVSDEKGAGIVGNKLPTLVLHNPRAHVGDIASWFYDKPFSSMQSVGITGTNGKTTTSSLLNQLWTLENRTTGFIGTTGIEVAGESIPTQLTTPEATELQALAACMLERHVTHCVMEVSSHSLIQRRVSGIHYNIAAFTNLTQDHLDFHKTMEAYFEAKSKLFTMEYTDLGFVNIDDPYGKRLYDSNSIPMVAVSRTNNKALWHYTSIHPIHGGYEVSLRGSNGILIEGFLPLIGAHNLDNALMAIAIAVETGVDPLSIAQNMKKLHGPAGRLEKVDIGQKFLALVDYAHTPDAVERVLSAIREITPGKVIGVLGCGGDRDAVKRPLMGAALIAGTDLAVMTSDNPRSESAEAILREMQGSYIVGDQLAVEVDRRGAIAIAVSEAQPGDTVILLGKGHEIGQEINGTKYPFDDRVELARAIENLA